MQQHHEHRFTDSDRLAGLVVGMSDGLIILFALVSGLSNVLLSTMRIWQAGLIVSIVGAIAMGVGGYYTSREESDDHDHDHDLHGLDLDEETQKEIKEQQLKEKEVWAEQKQANEMHALIPEPHIARQHALYIGLGYFFGGLIPVIPFMFYDTALQALKPVAIIVIAALMLFGFLRAKFTGRNPFIGALKITLAGTVTAIAAYFFAGLFI